MTPHTPGQRLHHWCREVFNGVRVWDALFAYEQESYETDAASLGIQPLVTRDPPIVLYTTWTALPLWIRTKDCHLAMEEDGRWFAYARKPVRGYDMWTSTKECWHVEVPPKYHPTYDGDWEDSLVKIPPAFVEDTK